MSKPPLRLAIYPKWRWYYRDSNGDPVANNIAVDAYSRAKRFRDAELAAEYWASHGEANQTMTGNPTLLFSRRATLRRFASLPHFDEVSQ